MSSGPDHYRKAERLADKAAAKTRGMYDLDPTERATLLAAAQVHATLAGAAAAIDAQIYGMDGTSQEWVDLLHPRPKITNHTDDQEQRP